MRARSPATSIASRHTPAALRKDLSLGFQSIAVDVMFPMLKLTTAVTAFHAAFPLAPLRLYAETLGAVMQALLDGPGELAKHIQLVLTDRSTPSKKGKTLESCRQGAGDWLTLAPSTLFCARCTAPMRRRVLPRDRFLIDSSKDPESRLRVSGAENLGSGATTDCSHQAAS